MTLNEKGVIDFSYQAWFLKVTNPAISILLNCSADAQLHLEAGLNLKTWTTMIFMKHIRNSVFHSWSVACCTSTPYMSGPSLLEATRFTDVKLAPISIALQKILFIYIKLQYYMVYCASSNSVTWREYTKSVSRIVW